MTVRSSSRRDAWWPAASRRASSASTAPERSAFAIGVNQKGGVYTFIGTTRRAEPGLQVTIARLDAATKRVTGVASAVTNAAGDYTIRTALPAGQAGY